MELNRIVCKSCGTPLRSDNVNLEAMLASCPSCGAMFGLAMDSDTSQNSSKPVYASRSEVPMPKQMSIDHEGIDFVLRRKWFGPSAIFLLVFAGFWNTFMIVWHGIALSTGQYIMSAFGLIHTVIGIGVAWAAIAGLLNTTTIRIGRGELSIKHAPVPMPGNLILQSDVIKQVYCRRRVSHSSKGGTSISYEVRAQLTDGSEKRLLKGLRNPEQALFIEQAVEKQMGIIDVQIPGDFRG